MGARGPHDDFESARKVIRAGYAGFTVDQDIEEASRKYFSEDVEWVTRNGVFHGPGPIVDAMKVQLENWRVETEVEDVFDAGGGAVIATLEVTRFDKATGDVAWKAWPALVLRVLDGKMVFNEGYVDRRKAFEALGVPEP